MNRIDQLENFIKEIDKDNNMEARELAERIFDWQAMMYFTVPTQKEIIDSLISTQKESLITTADDILAIIPHHEMEPAAVRFDYDGYGYRYMDSGSGSDWLTRNKDAEVLYQIHPTK